RRSTSIERSRDEQAIDRARRRRARTPTNRGRDLCVSAASRAARPGRRASVRGGDSPPGARSGGRRGNRACGPQPGLANASVLTPPVADPPTSGYALPARRGSRCPISGRGDNPRPLVRARPDAYGGARPPLLPDEGATL